MNALQSKARTQRQRYRRGGFVAITIPEYVERHVSSNPKANPKELTERLRQALQAKLQGALCECGESIWALGSAEVGLACFTCITGEATPDKDYEVTMPR